MTFIYKLDPYPLEVYRRSYGNANYIGHSSIDISQLTNLCTGNMYVGAFCFKMLPSVKFAEDKVLTFFILPEKC